MFGCCARTDALVLSRVAPVAAVHTSLTSSSVSHAGPWGNEALIPLVRGLRVDECRWPQFFIHGFLGAFLAFQASRVRFRFSDKELDVVFVVRRRRPPLHLTPA